MRQNISSARSLVLRRLLPLALAILVGSFVIPASAQGLLPPQPRRQPSSRSLFNITIFDDFSYLANGSLEALQYLRDEEAYAYAYINGNLAVPPATFEREFQACLPSVSLEQRRVQAKNGVPGVVGK